MNDLFADSRLMFNTFVSAAGIGIALVKLRKYRLPSILLIAALLLEIGLMFHYQRGLPNVGQLLHGLPSWLERLLFRGVNTMPLFLMFCAIFAGRESEKESHRSSS